MTTLLALSGLFAIGLGVWHVGVPRWFDFRGALRPNSDDGPVLRPLRFGPAAWSTTRQDVLGLSWVMSNAASFVLVSVGAVDLAGTAWLGTPGGALLGGWIAAWWGIRAVSQLALGRRHIDLALMALFSMLALLHVAAALA